MDGDQLFGSAGRLLVSCGSWVYFFKQYSYLDSPQEHFDFRNFKWVVEASSLDLPLSTSTELMLYLWKTRLQLINVSGCRSRVTYFLSRFFFRHIQIKVCMEGEIYWFALTVPSLSSHLTELELTIWLPLGKELDSFSILLLLLPTFRFELN